MDYASYLLSASPPGFDVQYRRYMEEREDPDFEEMGRRNKNRFYPVKTVIAKSNGVVPGLGELTLNTVSEYTDGAVESLKSLALSRSKRNQGTTLKKTVSFADENGLKLSSIREFTESPNSPPTLRRGLLSSLTRGAKADVTEKAPIVIQFPQPASDYFQFREKLERLNVSLENVILKDYNLLGTVKVKNIAFEKKVKIRCTYDDWESSTDFYATYVSNRQLNAHSPYDTFSFELSIPPNFDPKKNIQFVICYEVDGDDFWDNNNEANYVVSSRDWNSPCESEPADDQPESPPVFAPTLDTTQWAEFTSWSGNDSTIPYW